MADLLETFKRRAEDLITLINQKGGIKATIEGLRRQMAEADRRRAIAKVKEELKRLDRQINEMITAVGIQAVGLHQAGRLSSPELQPLCQHIVELRAALAQQEAELAQLEAQTPQTTTVGAKFCPSCGKTLPDGATFCPYCGAAVPQLAANLCAYCGAELRPQAKFCAKCGQAVETPR